MIAPSKEIQMLAAVGVATCLTAGAHAQEIEGPSPTKEVSALELPSVDVIGFTPLPSVGMPIEKFAGNVQSITSEEIENQNPVDLSEALYRNLGSVNINSAQNNPWQNDVTYRGFLASPLTGSPIGLSVYVDGMRFNDGFGDTLSWDLIPQSAISSIDVIPGSNPLFGLNTLGGALAVRTKSGFAYQGTEVELQGGSFGRWGLEAEHGGYKGPIDYYMTFNGMQEDGWRDASGSELRQFFGKAGWENDRTDVDLSYIYANNDLTGNGYAPESLLALDRSAVHTFPDNTLNEQHLVNLSASHELTKDLLLAGNAYYRDYQRDTLNGDAEVTCVNDLTDEEVFTDAGGEDALPVSLCSGSAAGFFDADGNALLGALERDTEGEDRTTSTESETWGGTLQLSRQGQLFGHGNSATIGFAYDQTDSRFTQSEREGDIVDVGNSRTIIGEGAFETEVDVDTSQEDIGFYLTDTFDITERLALTLSGRYQHVNVEISDNTGDPENADVNGDHSFDRFNPAAGLTFQLMPKMTVFGSYSEGFRAPTAAELTCADPDDPCNLPNAFVADPPLDPVVAKTYEFGARGHLPVGDALRWNAAFFRTDLSDDILFTVVETGGAGFFQNVGETRRQGVEVGAIGSVKKLNYFLSYAFVDATYESAETLASFVDAAGVPVEEGDSIPGIPQHNFRVGAEYEVYTNFWLGGDVIAASSTYLRGDDGNNLPEVDGYAILNLQARYAPSKHFELWGRIDNVTDADYETAGIRNFNAFADPIAEERFLAPGAPLAGWFGVKARF